MDQGVSTSGGELSAREAALQAQLSAVEAELHAARTAAGLPPPARGAALELARLRHAAAERPDDPEMQLAFADACLLAGFGGPGLVKATVAMARSLYDPDTAVAALEAAQRLRPADLEIARRLRTARRLAAPAILVAALPKSGTVFLGKSLQAIFGKSAAPGVTSGPLTNLVATDGFAGLVRMRGISVPHLAPVRSNLVELSEYFRLPRMVVHVRDPRQALVSYFHYIPHAVAAFPYLAAQLDLPEDFAAWPDERQLDWHIDRFFHWAVDWIGGWLAADGLPWFTTRILFTRFEDMARDPAALFRRMAEFFEIDAELLDPLPAPPGPGELNFRRGAIDEWRTALKPPQIERVTAAMPDTLFERFGWPRQ